MTNNYKNVENVGGNCDNIESLHTKNAITFPTSWMKCGEVFYNNLEQLTFVCSICLKNSDSINTVYTTNDASLFWWHIQQQHIFANCETLEKNSAEIADCASNKVGYQILCDDDIRSNLCGHVDSNDDEMKQNETHLQDLLHENVVKSNNIKEPETNLDTKIGTKNIHEENQLQDANKFITKEDAQINKLQENQNNSKDNYYCDGIATYTISDDEDEEKSSIKWAIRLGGENNARDYLRHNDMIEISDDEDAEDNIKTCPSSPTSVNNNTMISDADNNIECTENRKLNEDILAHANLVSVIPTPDVSPSDKFTAQDIRSQLQNNFSEYNDYSIPKDIQLLSKKSVTSFRSFQCELCGTRTVNEVNMKNHIEKFHQTVVQKCSTNHNHPKPYHQVYQPDQNKQVELMQSHGKKYVRKYPFKCKSCKIATKSLKAMERHQISYHGPDISLIRQICHICHKHILVSKLEAHIKLHFAKRFKCNYCEAVYAQRNYLKTHIGKCHPEHENINTGSESHTQKQNPNNTHFAPYLTNYIPPALTHQVQHQFGYELHDGGHTWDHYAYHNNAIPSQNLQ